MASEPPRVDAAREKARIESLFGRHISDGQVRYMKAGHLDVIETERQGTGFVDLGSGRRFFDCFSSAGCFNVGRHNPHVLAALDTAADALDLGSSHLVSPAKVELARRLIELAPAGLARLLYASGGGDAIDCALKLARGATGRPEIISTIKGYHGHVGFALSANGKEHYRHHFEPLMPDFTFVPFNDLEAVEKAASARTAAILVEPVQGEAGIFVASPDYLRGLRRIADRTGIVLIFDEIQTGFGRTGRLWASEHSGVVPDVMTLAKSFGGGLFPNAAVLYRDLPHLTGFVEANPYFHPTSTGGSDLGCRVSLAVLDELVGRRLWENAARQGDKLRAALQRLRDENPKVIEEVRGIGMMIGLSYIHEFLGPMMSDALAHQGVFAAYSGNAPQVMRFMLPISATDEETDRLVEAIRAAVARMRSLLPLALPAARIPPVLRLLNDERVQTKLFGWLREAEDLWNASARRSVLESGARSVSDQNPAGAAARQETIPAARADTGRPPEPLLADWGRLVSSAQVQHLEAIGHDLLEMERDGLTVRDARGLRYLDCTSASGIHNLGRRNADLARTLREAAHGTDQGNFPMISREKAELAQRLSRFVGGGLECAVFSVMRGESVDFACKLVRGATGRKELLAVSGSWFGQTGFAMTLSDRPDKDRYGPLVPSTGLLPAGDPTAIEKRITRQTAAVFVEPVQAENGCVVLDPAYLGALRARTAAVGAALVLDETQTGLGRTGGKFAFEHAGIVPDVLVVGEALGGGMFPIAATMSVPRLGRFMSDHPLIHLSTFGGSDIGCVVARRALDLYDEIEPWRNAAVQGAHLRAGIEEIRARAPGVIQEVKGQGLLLAVDLGSPSAARAFCKALAHAGVLAVPGALAAGTVVLRPPLTITTEEVDRVLDAIRTATTAVGR